MTERSSNEIAVMVQKAARGAGVPLGYCEDLAACVKWFGADIEPMVRALENAQAGQGIHKVQAAKLCVLALEDTLVDESEMVLNDVDEPHVARALGAQIATLNNCELCAAISGHNITMSLRAGGHQAAPVARVDVDDALWTRLNTMAQRTYVPATEASRLAGAGAGLTDND